MITRQQFWFSASVLFFSLFIPNSASGQEKPGANSRDALVMMTVTVRNHAGEYVMGLNRELLQLADEKEARSIDFFESSDSPVSIGILVDTSESMQFLELKEIARAESIAETLSRFLELANTNNEYFLASFDRSPKFLTEWTAGQSLAAQKIEISSAKRNTAFYDACFAAIEKFGTGRFSRKALMLISDGNDNLSRHTFKELRELLKASDITLYAIGLRQPNNVGSFLDMNGEGIMTELAEVTGGEAIFVGNKKQLNEAIESIAIRMRHQYRLGFRPAQDPSKKWHRLRLKINLPTTAPAEFSKLTLRTRQGYYTR